MPRNENEYALEECIEVLENRLEAREETIKELCETIAGLRTKLESRSVDKPVIQANPINPSYAPGSYFRYLPEE